MYQHQWITGEQVELPVGKAVCVGRNYAAHAQELGNAIPQHPLLFMKPATAFASIMDQLVLPRRGLHFETELALLVGTPLFIGSQVTDLSAIIGVSLALDLTDRSLQDELKANGHPWERAKAFDGALPIGPWLRTNQLPVDWSTWAYTLQLNGRLQQHGKVTKMLTSPPRLLTEICQHFSLQPGDVVLTGTPEGVGQLKSADELHLHIEHCDWHLTTQVK